MTSIATYAANQGVPGVRKQFTVALAAARTTLTYLVGVRNCKIVIVKATFISLTAGISPLETTKLQYVVPGSAAVDITTAPSATFGANGAQNDIPVTTSGALQLGAVPANAIVQLVDTISGGTIPIGMVVVDYIEDDGMSGQ